MRLFLVALGLLSTLPVPLRTAATPAEVARCRFAFPAVGLLLGGLLGGLAALLARAMPPMLAAFLLLLAWVAVTGALHLDGFCDLCDGLFGGRTPDDRLRILKDPHLGTFGLAGGVLLLLGKFVALTETLTRFGPNAGWPIAAAVAVARCLTLTVAVGARYPRPEGTGKVIVEAVRPWEGGMFGIFALASAGLAIPAVGVGGAALGVLGAILAVLGLRRLCVRRLGGVTGDTLGAAIELAEGVVLLVGGIGWVPLGVEAPRRHP